jgi:gentisate 1,2-dioxygenase
MKVRPGDLLSYTDYLSQTLRHRESPTLWKWRDIRIELDKQIGSDQGTFAISREDANDPATPAPGISIVIQRVRARELTPAHQHSFWHLYWVSEGHGSIQTGGAIDQAPLAPGDFLFVPAWCNHALDNRSGTSDLILIRLQNLPQNAEAGTLMREGPDGIPQPLYSSEKSKFLVSKEDALAEEKS